MAYRNYANTNGFIVAQNGTGDFITIQAAITAIIAKGLSIYKLCLTDASYTENVTFPAGGYVFSHISSIFSGTATVSSTGTVTFNNIIFNTNGAYSIVNSGANASVIYLNNCTINGNNFTPISFTNSNASSAISIFRGNGDVTDPTAAFFTHSSNGALNIIYSNIGWSSASTVQSTASAGILNIGNSGFFPPITTSGSNALGLRQSVLINPNATCLTVGGAGGANGNIIDLCEFASDANTSIIVNSTSACERILAFASQGRLA